MASIWKFPFTIVDHPVLAMPAGAKILSVQVQRGVPCIWAEVDPEAREEARRFRLVGTGHEVDLAEHRHVGTFQVREDLVFHLFEPTANRELVEHCRELSGYVHHLLEAGKLYGPEGYTFPDGAHFERPGD